MLARLARFVPLILLGLGLLGPLASAGAEADDVEFDPRFRPGASSDRLSAGPPRLTRAHIDAFIDLFETAFDVALPASVEAELRTRLVTAFEEGDEARREAFLAHVDVLGPMRARARCCDWRFIDAGLRRFRAEIDRRLRHAPDAPVNALLARVLRRRHEVVWRGEPAIKALAVEAYLEMALFVASLGRNEAIDLSPGQRKALITYLEKDLRRCSYATRTCLLAAHRTWLRAKARWDRSRDERRLRLRRQATEWLARLAPEPGGLSIRTGTTEGEYVRAASKVRAADSAKGAVAAVARQPQALLEVLCCGLGLGGQAPAYTFLYR